MQTGNPGAWVLTDGTVDASGDRCGARLVRLVRAAPGPQSDQGAAGAGQGRARGLLRPPGRSGYRQQLVYQPDSNFWPLQWAETGLFAGLSALLAGCCFWWTRRRLS